MFLLKINLMLNTQMLNISCCAEPAWLLSQLIPTEHMFKGLFESTHYKTGLAMSRDNGDRFNNSFSSSKQSVLDRWSKNRHVKSSHFI